MMKACIRLKTAKSTIYLTAIYIKRDLGMLLTTKNSTLKPLS